MAAAVSPEPPPPLARLIFSESDFYVSSSDDTYGRRRKCIVPENNHKSIWEIVNPNPEEEEEEEGEWLVIFCVEYEDDEEDDNNYSKDESWELGHCYLWNPDTSEKIELPSLLQWITTTTTTNDSDLEKPAAYFLSRCVLSSPSSSGASIRYSKGGWLLMSKGESKLFFFNPFTRRKIKLPHIEHEHEYNIIMSFSSVPTSSDCVVFAVVTYMLPSIKIYTIRRGQNFWRGSICRNSVGPPWGLHQNFETCLSNPVFFAEGFYCLDLQGNLGVFCSKGASGWKLIKTLKTPCTSFTRCFLVECDGNLLSVYIGNLGGRIKIFRLDSLKKKWVKVESLGKHMLFISDTTCLSAVASDGGMGNNVYFSRFHGEGILFYSLKTGLCHSVGSQHSLENFYNTKEQLNCGWIEPNWSSNTEQEKLDWLV